MPGQVNAIMVVTEPFATAYGIEEIAGSIVVDIGAGTTDIARVHGTFPTDEDQLTITEAGDWLDLELMKLISKKFTGAQITKDMVRKWKEASSYVGGDVQEVTVELSVEGKRQIVDIGDLIQYRRTRSLSSPLNRCSCKRSRRIREWRRSRTPGTSPP